MATQGYDEVINDTILYWDDYITNSVYGYSKYGLKTFEAASNKIYNENKEVFDNRHQNKELLYSWNKFIEETEITDSKTTDYKNSLLDLYDAYDKLYTSIFAFNTSYNGFKQDTNTAINNYNRASQESSYYSDKYNNKYLEEYDDFVTSIGFDKYCKAWSTDEYGKGYANFQNCFEEIAEKLEIE